MPRGQQMSYDLFGQHVSEDTILKSMKTIGQALLPFSLALKALLLLAPVLHADETGVRVLKKLVWLHILCTPTLTWYGVHEKRGQEAVDFFGILPLFKNRTRLLADLFCPCLLACPLQRPYPQGTHLHS